MISHPRFLSLFAAFLLVAPSALAAPLLTANPGATLNTAVTTPSGASRVAHVPILIYHSVRPFYPGITNLVKEFTVPPDVFDEQMAYLKNNGFTPITFDELSNYLNNGTPLPSRPVIITLDDGWENQYHYAFPILEKYHFKAVFYVYPNAIGVAHFMTYPELQEMSRAGMVIADHTQSHPQLPKVNDPVRLRQEISGSRDILEQKLNITIRDFAYPFGAYNATDVDYVRQAGYRTARTVHSGLTADANAPYTIDGIITTSDFNRFVYWVNK